MRKINIPILGGGAAPPPPPYGGLGEAGWSRGRTFLEIVESASDFGAELDAAFRAVRLSEAQRRFFSEYPRRVRVLALTAMPAADSLFNVAQAEYLFSLGKNIWMRQYPAVEHADLVALFQPREETQPLLVLFGDDKREFARWGPQPRKLVDLETKTLRASTPSAHEELRRTFYAQSQGSDLASELQELLATRL